MADPDLGKPGNDDDDPGKDDPWEPHATTPDLAIMR